MERFDDELSDEKLRELLLEWSAPAAPARLRSALFPEAPAGWWRRVWTASIRVPVPVVLCMALLLVLLAWRWPKSSGPVRNNASHELQPVTELRPRIIRRVNVPH